MTILLFGSWDVELNCILKGGNGHMLAPGSWTTNKDKYKTTFFSSTKKEEKKVVLHSYFTAQEPRYGCFLSFINSIQKAEIEIQKIKIAKNPELI